MHGRTCGARNRMLPKIKPTARDVLRTSETPAELERGWSRYLLILRRSLTIPSEIDCGQKFVRDFALGDLCLHSGPASFSLV